VRTTRKVKKTLVVGFALLVVVGAYTLTRSPSRVVGSGAAPVSLLGATSGRGEVCQANEVLPADVTAIRLSLAAYFGAKVRVAVSSASRLLTEGRRGPEWTGRSITVPVKPLSRPARHVRVCVSISSNSEAIFFSGSPAPIGEAATLPNGQSLSGRLDIEYLVPGSGSWWSRILPVARHLGLGRAFSGTWIVLVIAAMVAAVGVLAVRLTLRELP
jgi:hypothetical protein